MHHEEHSPTRLRYNKNNNSYIRACQTILSTEGLETAPAGLQHKEQKYNKLLVHFLQKGLG
jgi:hypothetical protein